MTKELVHYFTYQDKTVFMPFKYIYPECLFHIKDSPQLFPMKCFIEDACPVGTNCGEILVKRVHYLFDNVFTDDVELLIAYFKYRDRPNSIRGAIFYKDLRDPKVGILNPYAFRKFQKGGITYSWVPTDEYSFMGGSKGIITVDTLIR